MTRRSYTREFKAEAVRLVNDQGLSCAEAAPGPGSASERAVPVGERVWR